MEEDQDKKKKKNSEGREREGMMKGGRIGEEEETLKMDGS